MPSPTDPAPEPAADAPPGPTLTLGQAIILGALHGPAELMPISSSGHMAILPWLLRWDYADADPELRKAFEVVLHAGTAAALVITLRPEVEHTLKTLSVRTLLHLAVSAAPAGLVGLAFESRIERHLGTPATIAAGLLAGSLAMAAADRRPQARTADEVTTLDALLIGLAQACALMPGVSRNGATLAAARRRAFTRTDANRLSRRVAVPVIGGATFLKTLRLARRGLPPGSAAPFAAGAAAAFASTLGSTWVIRQVERDRTLLPYAAYRAGLAALVVWRLRQPPPPGIRQ